MLAFPHCFEEGGLRCNNLNSKLIILNRSVYLDCLLCLKMVIMA